LSSAFGRRGGVETRASNSVFPHWCDIRHVPQASRLRRGIQALCLSTKVVLRRGLQALHLNIGRMLGRRLRALRFGITRVTLISLVSEAW